VSESAKGTDPFVGAGDEERLATARDLVRNPRPEALGPLTKALKRERVSWVRTALKEAIVRCQALGETPGLETEESSRPDEDDLDRLQAYADGRREGMRQVLHELASPLGLAHAALAREPTDIEGAIRQLGRMRHIAGALRSLIGASGVAQASEFDFAPHLSAFEVSPPVECPDGLVAAQGPQPFPVRGDRDLLELAVQPLVANAIEAVLGIGGDPPARGVIVSWGPDRQGCYVAVIDEGPGPPARLEELIALGASDKPGHIGFGLETARTAIASMDGKLTLERNRRGGATAILRWPGRA
jgi:signal transduction histidine kinase